MSFQAYIDNIHKLTGKTPDDFYAAAKSVGILDDKLTATIFVDWLKRDFELGRGHAMALWALFKSKRWVQAPSGSKSK